MISKKIVHVLVACLLLMADVNLAQAQKFEAIGPRSPVQLDPEQFLGAVKVTFDSLPTTMSFDLPWHFSMVSENGLKFANLAAETYDLRSGADSLYAPGMDKEGHYVRIWIEQASDARIIVRVRYALCNANYEIAHCDIESGSPYGDGDWGDEWYYIYPDGTFVRHIRLYTGLAPLSQPFVFNLESSQFVHEFMNSVVIGPTEHVPTDDINIDCLRLIKLIGNHTGHIYQGGIDTVIAYDPCPEGYGQFSNSNIMLINSKSEYKPFTIGLPYGASVQPYVPDSASIYPFETWTGYDEPSIGYVSALGHMLNYWHFRRTQTTLEQIYLQGMTNEAEPKTYLVKLAWSWIVAPGLTMPGLKSDYFKFTYDQTQKAYIVPRNSQGPEKLEFTLESYENMNAPMRLVNPAFVVKDWNDTVYGFVLKVNDIAKEAGKDYRFGYEQSATGKDLVIWLKMNTATKKTIAIEPAPNSIAGPVKSEDVSIRPNPATNKIYIDLSGTSELKIEIYSIDGRICFANSYKSENITIDISDLTEGMYIVSIKSKDGSYLANKQVIKN